MNALNDQQLQQILHHLSPARLSHGFSARVMEKIYAMEEADSRLLRKILFVVWGVLLSTLGGFSVLAYKEMMQSGFFDYAGLLYQNFASEYRATLFSSLLSTLPLLPVFGCLLFFILTVFCFIITKKIFSFSRRMRTGHYA
ncbi:MAG: hypothetical protein WCP97_01145 [bacterium]